MGLANFLVVLRIAVRALLAAPVPRHPATPSRSGPDRSVWDSVYSEAQARRGDTVYASYCSSCHGETLAGIDDAKPLAGGDFLAGWSGLNVGTLFGRIQRTMPQDNSVVLTPRQIADVVAYILSYNRFPAGTTELGTDAIALAAIRITGTRPRPDSGGTHDSRGNHR